jgi:iron only hydrogenase large subunit-like protein/uncharacterized Fe-S cluster-containing protein
MSECLKLKKSNCKNCYKCIRYCPVKSIRFSDNQAHIIEEDCILCGECFLACPQNAKEIRKDVDVAKELIASGKPVFASIAPSFVSNYDGLSLAAMERTLTELGFAGVEETAIGATMVAKQYETIVANKKSDLVISTCCHTINLLIQKYYPEVIPNMAPVISPMQAHCRDLKHRYGDIKTVFIGPCISKKAEAENCREDVDCVLTFEELTMWVDGEDKKFESADEATAPFLARMFPTAGGILKTMTAKDPDYTYIAVDGIDRCISAINDIKQGKMHRCFIEMSACQGSCINGPVMDKKCRTPIRDYIAISDFSGEDNLVIPPERMKTLRNLRKKFNSLASPEIHLPDSAMEEVLRKMGKTKPEHELNCGSCGYNTCRDKARAIIEGKADLTMCLPFLKEKAESFSDTIINHTPNGIIVVNENFQVQLVNEAACELLRIKSPSEILGDQVVRVLDPSPFINAYKKGENTYAKKEYLAEYKKYVEQTVIYDINYHIIICIMRDVTTETIQLMRRQELSRNTIEITDKVIEKQMRTVQEIASLLGETTAETKVALTKLKESLYD